MRSWAYSVGYWTNKKYKKKNSLLHNRGKRLFQYIKKKNKKVDAVQTTGAHAVQKLQKSMPGWTRAAVAAPAEKRVNMGNNAVFHAAAVSWIIYENTLLLKKHSKV